MKKTLFFKKSLAILLSITMTVGNIGFVRANQLTIDKIMVETQSDETATGEQTETTETLSNEGSEQTENEQLQDEDENEIEDTLNLQVNDNTEIDDNQLNNEIVLPKAINDKFKVYMDDSYKANMPVREFKIISKSIFSINAKVLGIF